MIIMIHTNDIAKMLFILHVDPNRNLRGRIHVNHISEIPVMEHLAMENDEKNVDLPMKNMVIFQSKSLVYQRVYDFILGGTCCPYNLIFAWHLAPA